MKKTFAHLLFIAACVMVGAVVVQVVIAVWSGNWKGVSHFCEYVFLYTGLVAFSVYAIFSIPVVLIVVCLVLMSVKEPRIGWLPVPAWVILSGYWGVMFQMALTSHFS
jgi:hypothetical protein